LGDRKGIRPVKVGYWFIGSEKFDWSFVRLAAPTVTTASIIFSSSITHNGDVVVSANPGSPGKKWPLKQRHKECAHGQLLTVLVNKGKPPFIPAYLLNFPK